MRTGVSTRLLDERGCSWPWKALSSLWVKKAPRALQILSSSDFLLAKFEHHHTLRHFTESSKGKPARERGLICISSSNHYATFFSTELKAFPLCKAINCVTWLDESKGYWNKFFHFHYPIELWTFLSPIEKPYYYGVLCVTDSAGSVCAWQTQGWGFESMPSQAIFFPGPLTGLDYN